MQDPRSGDPVSAGDGEGAGAGAAEAAARGRRPGAGRPRDAALEDRVYDAAMHVYAETGWSGFSIERIARHAGVGKAAIYARWSDKRDILRDTFERRWEAIEEIDEGSLRGDLEALVAMAVGRYRDNRGAVALHAQVDGMLSSEFREMALPFLTRAARPMFRMLARAQERGEMDPGIRKSLAVLLIMGPIASRFARIETTPREMTGPEAEAFCAELVDLLERALAPRG
ncbi:TetR/AcrR family transcriptional regulator [Albimonas sp. CAU 1670]|uniref:TetR/AcrR family transcriptional regulator n=1 Tax=Albimonas sp. CAU 1670 TaxID=3032599 RepID=UPI0023DCA121|nr:TetR/AcrR family transcriptional regulator [Albimonas sp. CAU 1670]MDF2233782.1 TetR/AcrR family transcriptional regulator [Albimonas sp. CAU 1670]